MAKAAEVFARLEGQPMSRVERMFADSKYHNYALYERVADDAHVPHAVHEDQVVRAVEFLAEIAEDFHQVGPARRLSTREN